MDQGIVSHPQLRLYTRAQGLVLRTLITRIAIVVGLVAFFTVIFYLDRDGLKDNADGEVSGLDVIYFTMVTLATVGYGDIASVTDRLRLIDTIFIGPVRFVIWFIFLGTAYQFVVQRVMEDLRLARLQRKLSGHVVICGFGDSGGVAAAEIIASGRQADQVVVVDRTEDAVKAAADLGHIGLRGDSTLQKTLEEAGVGRARAVIVCVGRDDTAVLTILTVRQFNMSAKIICSAKEEENISLIKQAGADTVIQPARVSGYLLADALENSFVSEYVSDLLTRGGNVRMCERPARPDDIGKRLRDLGDGLGVRIHRGGDVIGFWQDDKAVIQAGDTLLLIQPEPPPAA